MLDRAVFTCRGDSNACFQREVQARCLKKVRTEQLGKDLLSPATGMQVEDRVLLQELSGPPPMPRHRPQVSAVSCRMHVWMAPLAQGVFPNGLSM